jgi:hypothetical protein
MPGSLQRTHQKNGRARFTLCVLAACGSPATASVTTARPVVDDLAAVKADIAHERWEPASAALLQIVCGKQPVHVAADFAKCTSDASEAWGLVGDVALGRNFVFSDADPKDELQPIPQLEAADVAYTRAAAHSNAPRFVYMLGLAQEHLRHWPAAFATFVKGAALGAREYHAENVDGIVACITAIRWRDSDPDELGFARPEVRAALAPQEPWVAEVLARAIQTYIVLDCDAGRTTLAELTRRFPTSPSTTHAATVYAEGCKL